MMIRVDSSMAGGCRCNRCGRVDEGEVVSTFIDWRTEEVQNTVRCSVCGFRELFTWKIDKKLVFQVDKQAYEQRPVRGEL